MFSQILLLLRKCTRTCRLKVRPHYLDSKTVSQSLGEVIVTKNMLQQCFPFTPEVVAAQSDTRLDHLDPKLQKDSSDLTLARLACCSAKESQHPDGVLDFYQRLEAARSMALPCSTAPLRIILKEFHFGRRNMESISSSATSSRPDQVR